MKRIGIEKARRKLAEAEAEFAAITTVKAKAFGEFETAWVKVLVALNGVYTTLEQAAKVNAQSRQWFGARKRERREDPLLQYFHQARNAEEHGLERIVEERVGGIVIGDVGGELTKTTAMLGDVEIDVWTGPDPSQGKHGILPRRAKLRVVHDDRFGDSFHPPTMHLGKPLGDPSIIGMVTAAIEYHCWLVEEAAKLPE